MNASMTTDPVLREFLRLLTALRISLLCDDMTGYHLGAGRCWGFIAALSESNAIAHGDRQRLDALVTSAIEHCWLPFPDQRNAGPQMPYFVQAERDCSGGGI